MRFTWSELSQQHLDSMFLHIAEENETAARKLVVRIVSLTESILQRHPSCGRPGREPGTRELVISKTPYTVSYKVSETDIYILAVWHQARRWPEKF